MNNFLKGHYVKQEVNFQIRGRKSFFRTLEHLNQASMGIQDPEGQASFVNLPLSKRE